MMSRPAWVPSLIMMIFRAASSWDIGWGAYCATGTELDGMLREAQGLCRAGARGERLRQPRRTTAEAQRKSKDLTQRSQRETGEHREG
jgi:hypothetical protein